MNIVTLLNSEWGGVLFQAGYWDRSNWKADWCYISQIEQKIRHVVTQSD